MKKNLILAMLLMCLCLPSFAQSKETTKAIDKPRMEMGVDGHSANTKDRQKHVQRRAEFESRLNLTEEQKAKAKEIRAKGRKEMAPVMEAMDAKRKEMASLRETNASKEEFEKVKSDMNELHKKAHELRMSNMKEFEAILTPAQQKELKKMKEEGRKKFEKSHKKPNKCCKKDCGCKKHPDAQLHPQPKKPVESN